MITDLYSERLHLRKMSTDDAPSLFNIWSDAEVTEFMNIDPFSNEDQAKEMITSLDQLSREEKAIRYSIIELISNRIIGSCGFNSIDAENAKAEIGYDLSRTYWGKGYATEAVTTLLQHAFHSLKLNRVEAKVEPENVASIKLLQKLNFTFEGTLRQSEKSKGRFIDLHLYSKLKND
ncbi:GNAT family N-acetyltransferase [Alkalihalophilus sp. As8PL]|uniref:GNAT family N-acetyltransferase n=1 Tax=Alkalihalophilus sp. As8PL TaxID=3237103 RepID=A0AB39BVI8_9BACI